MTSEDGEAERLAARAKLPYPINRRESTLCVAEYVCFIGAAGVGLGLRQAVALAAFGFAFIAASITLYMLMKRRVGFTDLRPHLFLRGIATRSMWVSIQILRGRSPWEPRA